MAKTKPLHCKISESLHSEISAQVSRLGRGRNEITIEGLNLMMDFLSAGKDNATLMLVYHDGRLPKQYVLDSLG